MKESKHNNIQKGIVSIFIANVINLIISLFTGFVLPKYLLIETYADIKAFQLYINYIGILHFGFSDGMYLRIGGKNIEKINKKEVNIEFGTFKIFQGIVSILLIVISIFLKNKILIMTSLVIYPINISNYLRNLYSASGQFKKYSLYTNINTLLIFFINIILLFIIKTNSSTIYLISYIIAYFLYCFFIDYENNKIFGKTKITFKIKYFVNNIKTGFILMFGNFCNVIFTSLDRLFVQYFLGIIKFAYYSFAVSIENLINVFITPISTVMYNYFCNNKTQDQVILIKRYLIIIFTFFISLIFGAKFIIEIWITKYIASIEILFLLVGAQYISIIIRCVHINLYKSFKKQNRYFIIMLVIVVLSLVLNITGYLLYQNSLSIAIATLITNIVWFVLGEIDYKEYMLNIKDYIFITAILTLFLYCGFVFNSVLGFVIYLSFSVILIFIFMKNTFVKILIEISKFLKYKISKKEV